MTETLRDADKDGKTSEWCRVQAAGPYLFDLGMPLVCPRDEETVGAIVLLNNNDDDFDGVEDRFDDFIPNEDSDFAPVALMHPPERPVSLSAGGGVIRLYENRRKKLNDRHGGGWIYNSEVGACTPAAYQGYDDNVFLLEGVEVGETMLEATCEGYTDKIRVRVVGARLVPDWNHDRRIDEADWGEMRTNGGPFRFWVNDDDDRTATEGNDIPGQSPNDAGNGQVDSVRDLVDFFPVFVDLADTLSHVDVSDMRFVLCHGPGALNFIETDLTPETAGDYLTDVDTALALDSATVRRVREGRSESGRLSNGFLEQIRSHGGGIILVEARFASIQPLVLEIRDRRGRCLASVEMPLSISGVEEMYRHRNLRQEAGGSEMVPDRLGEPSNYPNELCNGRHFLFLHGYSTSEQAARGWQAEVFKRLFWSGSRARFHGITWWGNDSERRIPLLGSSFTPDYHVWRWQTESVPVWPPESVPGRGGAC